MRACRGRRSDVGFWVDGPDGWDAISWIDDRSFVVVMYIPGLTQPSNRFDGPAGSVRQSNDLGVCLCDWRHSRMNLSVRMHTTISPPTPRPTQQHQHTQEESPVAWRPRGRLRTTRRPSSSGGWRR